MPNAKTTDITAEQIAEAGINDLRRLAASLKLPTNGTADVLRERILHALTTDDDQAGPADNDAPADAETAQATPLPAPRDRNSLTVCRLCGARLRCVDGPTDQPRDGGYVRTATSVRCYGPRQHAYTVYGPMRAVDA